LSWAKQGELTMTPATMPATNNLMLMA